MSGFKRLEDIDAWKEGCRLAVKAYKLTQKEAFSKDFGLRDQLRRSAVSISSNIAEGFERDSPKDFVRFLRIAKGSAGELRTQLYIARSLGYLTKEESEQLVDHALHISSMISRLIQYLERENVSTC